MPFVSRGWAPYRPPPRRSASLRFAAEPHGRRAKNPMSWVYGVPTLPYLKPIFFKLFYYAVNDITLLGGT